MLVVLIFIELWTQKHGNHPIYSDGDVLYQEAISVLVPKQGVHSQYKKNVIEKVNKYLKGGIEGLDAIIHVLEDETGI